MGRKQLPVRKRIFREILREMPFFPNLLFWVRRCRKENRIRRVLVTQKSIAEHYEVASQVVFPALLNKGTAASIGAVTKMNTIRVLSKPSGVVTNDWTLLWPFSPQLQRQPNRCDLLWRDPAKERYLAGQSLYAVVDGFSYYHWMTGTVPKLLLAQKAGYRLSAFDHVIVNPKHRGPKNFQTEILEHLGIAVNKVIWVDRAQNFLCDEMVLPSEPCFDHQVELASWGLKLMRDELLPYAKNKVTHDFAIQKKKIVISRKRARRRRLVNEPEVAAALASHGFEAVDLEDYTLAQQINLFWNVSDVVALHGAGLTNLMFCQPGVKVIEIVPEAWNNPCFELLAHQVGATYKSVRAKSLEPKRLFASDAMVDLKAILAVL